MKKITAFIFALLVLTVMLVCFFCSGIFKVQAVNVYYPEDNGKFDYNDINAVSKECIGTHILRVSEKKLSYTIESQIPYCKVTDIEKIFPNKILVKTDLRQPIILVQISNRTDVCALIDSELKVVDIVSINDPDPTLPGLHEEYGYTVLGGLPYVPGMDVRSLPGTFINYEQEGYQYFGTLKDLVECIFELTKWDSTSSATFCEFFDFVDFTKAGSENKIYISGNFGDESINIGTKSEMMSDVHKLLIKINKQ